jgi:succinoglycan biosynthesis protein ExoM
MIVSICFVTYNRPQELKRLLEGLNQLTFNQIATPQIEVIVIDNDTKGVAQKTCAGIENNFQWILKTDVESKRGISYARNKSISLTSPETDFIAILDDDEVPKPNWLEELLLVQQEYSSDIVAGRVISHLPKEITNWIIKGKFFQHKSRPTGELRHVAYTNNVLIKGKIIRNLERIFDERFALTGGEDSELFLRLRAMNYQIVWADRAIVEEWVYPNRTNLAWILKRGYRSWSTYSLLEKELQPSLKIQLVRIIKGFGLIIIGCLKLIPACLIGKHEIANSLLSISRGLGAIAALLGINNYQLYKHSFKVVE